MATTSEKKWAPDARCLVEIETAARENMMLATTAPLMQPATWAGRYAAASRPTQAAESGVDKRHDRVEVPAGNGAEHQDNCEQPRRRGRRVLEQL